MATNQCHVPGSTGFGIAVHFRFIYLLLVACGGASVLALRERAHGTGAPLPRTIFSCENLKSRKEVFEDDEEECKDS